MGWTLLRKKNLNVQKVSFYFEKKINEFCADKKAPRVNGYGLAIARNYLGDMDSNIKFSNNINTDGITVQINIPKIKFIS